MGGGSKAHWIKNILYAFLEELFYLSMLKLLCGAGKNLKELFMILTHWPVMFLEVNGSRD